MTQVQDIALTHEYEMFCERYRCHMSHRTCILKQKKFDTPSGYSTWGRDTGCGDCDQGKAIRKAAKKKTGRKPAVTSMQTTIQTTIQTKENTDMTAIEMIRQAAAKVADINGTDGQDVPALPEPKQEKKWCAKCREYHPANTETFYKDAKSKTRLSSWCRAAQREASREYKLRKMEKALETAEVIKPEKPAETGILPDPPVQRDRAAARRELDLLEQQFTDRANTEAEHTAPEQPAPADDQAEEQQAGYSAVDNKPDGEDCGIIDQEDFSKCLVLDFSEYPGLLDRIEKLAHRQHRIPEQQVMFWAELGVRSTEYIADNDETAWWAREETHND